MVIDNLIPLTVRVTMPSGWSNDSTVMQAGKTLEYKKANGFIIFDAMPNDGIITVATNQGSHKHNLEHKAAVAATCTKTGTVEYWKCTSCGKLFSDAAATHEITDSVNTAKNPSNHTGGTELRSKRTATATAAGYTGDTYCLDCGALLSKGSVIDKLPSGAITSVTITGVKMPVVGETTAISASSVQMTSLPANACTISSLYWYNSTDCTKDDTVLSLKKVPPPPLSGTITAETACARGAGTRTRPRNL